MSIYKDSNDSLKRVVNVSENISQCTPKLISGLRRLFETSHWYPRNGHISKDISKRIPGHLRQSIVGKVPICEDIVDYTQFERESRFSGYKIPIRVS